MTIEEITTNHDFVTPVKNGNIIKVIGVGGGGNNAVSHMYQQGIEGVSFVICNTDRQALLNSPVPTKLMIGDSGLGAGAKPDVARQAAEDSAEEIKRLFDDDTKMVFVTAGMGGGTGTGAGPVVARLAREREILTVGIVTIPFLFEGQRKILKALDGAEEMSKYVDALLVINNERLTEIYPDYSFMNAFGKADDTLSTAARGISELITAEGIINIDFNDVDTTLRNGGAAIISIGYGEGENRVTKAINDALNSPILKDRDVFGSKRILFNIYFNPEAEQEFVISESNELTEFINNIDPEVDVIWGIGYDTTLGNKVKITLLAAGFESSCKTEENRLLAERGIRANSKPLFSGNAELTVSEQPKVVDPLEKVAKLYGEEKTKEILNSGENRKIVVLDPSQLANDSIIESFEKSPTYSRDRREAENIKNSARNASILPEAEGEDQSDSTQTPHSGTRIEF